MALAQQGKRLKCEEYIMDAIVTTGDKVCKLSPGPTSATTDDKQTRLRQLFRKEACQDSAIEAIGTIFLKVNVAYEFYILLGILLTLGLCVWFYFGTYQEKTVAKGYLDFQPHLLEIFPHAPGIVVKTMAHIGQKVNKGEVLFSIDTTVDGVKQKLAPHFKEIAHIISKMEQDIVRKRKRLREFKKLLDKHFLSVLQYENEKRELRDKEQALEQLKMSNIKSKIAQAYVIMAPITGFIESLSAQLGSYVDEKKPLLKIKPVQAKWCAKLFIPVKQLRFIKLNREVLLRYDAYSYRRYGLIKGTIKSAAHSISQPDFNSRSLGVQGAFYEIYIKIKKPYVQQQNDHMVLYQGMSLDAVIRGNKLAIWKWVWNKII